MQKSQWLPRGEQDFVDLCQKWKTVLEKYLNGQGKGDEDYSSLNWDRDECGEVLDKITAFLEARAAWEADDSTPKRNAKNSAKKEAEAAMRGFAASSVRFNKKVPPAIRTALNILPRDTTPTYHSKPAFQPDIVVENTPNKFEHKLRAINRATGKAKKPDDAYGQRFAWQVGGTKPASGGDLPKGKFTRKTSLVVSFTEAEKGKPVYYACCYENAKGEEGPWSQIEEAIIA